MMAKQKVALDCLSYHASAAIDDTEELAKAAIPTANTYSLHRYEYILNTVFVFVLRKRKTKVIHIQSANTKSQGKLLHNNVEKSWARVIRKYFNLQFWYLNLILET